MIDYILIISHIEYFLYSKHARKNYLKHTEVNIYLKDTDALRIYVGKHHLEIISLI